MSFKTEDALRTADVHQSPQLLPGYMLPDKSGDPPQTGFEADVRGSLKRLFDEHEPTMTEPTEIPGQPMLPDFSAGTPFPDTTKSSVQPPERIIGEIPEFHQQSPTTPQEPPTR